jgi:uncharacterized protein (TIGR02001 family)
MNEHSSHTLRRVAAATTLAIAAIVAPVAANAGATGNIGVFSKYVLRGYTNNAENDNTAVQGGFDYSSDAGWFVGYWGSNLDYTYDADTVGPSTSASGFENDFYAGYSFAAGPVTLTVGATQYYYIEVEDSDLFEPFFTAAMGPVTLGVKYLAQDGFWGNQGDMYWTLSAGTDLPKGFKLSGTLGYYMYEEDDSKEICGGTAKCGLTQTDGDFRHLDITLSHPIAKTGADMLVTYIVGGKDRTDTDLDNTMVFAVKYGFDL